MYTQLQKVLDRVRKTNRDGSPYPEYSHSNTDYTSLGRDILYLTDYIEELEEEYREPLQWELNRGSAYIVLKDGRDDEFFIKGQEQEAVECLLADLYHNQYNDEAKIPSYIILDKDLN
jgi:hypothetical protein